MPSRRPTCCYCLEPIKTIRMLQDSEDPKITFCMRHDVGDSKKTNLKCWKCDHIIEVERQAHVFNSMTNRIGHHSSLKCSKKLKSQSEIKRQMPVQRSIVYDDWINEFKPIKNKNGTLFIYETNGKDLAAIQKLFKVSPRKIWTRFVNNSISSGFHVVNRLNYFVTERAVPANTFIDVFNLKELDLKKSVKTPRVKNPEDDDEKIDPVKVAEIKQGFAALGYRLEENVKGPFGWDYLFRVTSPEGIENCFNYLSRLEDFFIEMRTVLAMVAEEKRQKKNPESWSEYRVRMVSPDNFEPKAMLVEEGYSDFASRRLGKKGGLRLILGKLKSSIQELIDAGFSRSEAIKNAKTSIQSFRINKSHVSLKDGFLVAKTVRGERHLSYLQKFVKKFNGRFPLTQWKDDDYVMEKGDLYNSTPIMAMAENPQRRRTIPRSLPFPKNACGDSSVMSQSSMMPDGIPGEDESTKRKKSVKNPADINVIENPGEFVDVDKLIAKIEKFNMGLACTKAQVLRMLRAWGVDESKHNSVLAEIKSKSGGKFGEE